MAYQVLIVDDESMIADSIGRILQRKGFEPSVVYSGTDALAELQKNDFDLVIADLLMGNVGGEEILMYLQENKSGCPVIIMTAYGDSEIHEKLIRNGAVKVLTKPFDDIMVFPEIATAAIINNS